MTGAWLVAFAAIVAIMASAPASAVVAALAPSDRGAAVAAGRGMAQRHEGYTIAPYLLFAVDDALTIVDDDATIEAIQVGTPYERLRYEAFVKTEQRAPFGSEQIAQFARAAQGRLDLIVFAHSRGENDRDFMQAFSGGALERDDGTWFPAAMIERTPPVEDGYLRPNHARTTRWLGQVTYRFDANVATAPPFVVAFTFADDRGTVHRYPITLSRYR